LAGDALTAQIEQLGAELAQRPRDAGLRYRLGCLLEDHGRIAEAADAYRAALQIDPAFAKARNNLGGVLEAQGFAAQALECYEAAALSDPKLWQPRYNIGNFHKLAGRLDRAVRPFQEAVRLKRAAGVVQSDSDATFSMTSRSKLLHDIEQFDYLMERGAIGPDFGATVVAYREALAALSGEFERGHLAGFPPALQARVAPVYNRLVNFYDAPELDGPAVNPGLDRARVEADYFRNGPGIVYVDDILTPQALRELRRFCLESTVWFDCHYSDGYLGAYVEEGFICPLLAQIAREFPRVLPGIFGDHFITHLWGYKYDSSLAGINIHGDFAAVNVNFWITPDQANLAPASGGLVVWDKEAPLDWDFDTYNKDVPKIQRFLDRAGAKPVTVPYRQNRVVIFNSDLFHKTDELRFRPGYENRRINITMLYGDRGGK
jgi:tetratricopeptide (TPR) repeat protein